MLTSNQEKSRIFFLVECCIRVHLIVTFRTKLLWGSFDLTACGKRLKKLSKIVRSPIVIFNQKYKFSQGLPKIHEHDAKRPQALGIVKEGRLVVLFTLETDLGDGWEDPEVHNDPENRRQEALRMGANIISYVFSN